MPREMRIPLHAPGCEVAICDSQDSNDVDEHAGASLALLAGSGMVLEIRAVLEEFSFDG